MQIYTLPADLGMDVSEPLHVFNYRTSEDTLKAKVNLNRNTISFLRTGLKEVMGYGRAEQINQDSFLMMKSGNCLMTEKISDANKIYQSILFFFDAELALKFLERHGLHSAARVDEKAFFVFRYDAYIQGFVSSLEQVLNLPQPTQQKILKAKFEEIMLYLVHEYGPSFLLSIVQHVDDRTSRLSNVVDHNKFNKLSLEELAFLCNMSISTFKREFYKQYQQTPIKWFNEQRLQHIATLLRTHHKRPVDLYEEAGYENFSNFIQAFKKQFGMTPKQYQSGF